MATAIVCPVVVYALGRGLVVAVLGALGRTRQGPGTGEVRERNANQLTERGRRSVEERPERSGSGDGGERSAEREKRWTLLVLSDGTEPVRRYSFGSRAIRRMTVLAAFVGTVGVTLAAGAATWLVTGLVPGVGWDLYNDPVAVAVEEELEDVHSRVEELESEIVGLEEREARLRAVAGLADPDAGLMAGMEADRWGHRHHLFWTPSTEDGAGRAGADETGFETAGGGDPAFYAGNGREASVRSGIQRLESRSRLLARKMDHVSDSLNARRTRLRATPSLLPASGFVSSGYSYARDHPIYQEARPHTGVDLAAAYGTPIRAAAAGEVRFAGFRAGYGRVVEIDHGLGYTTLYGHASEIEVEEGDWVDRGDVIAAVGSTGTATSPHLHYEVHVEGEPVDPQEYLASNPAARD